MHDASAICKGVGRVCRGLLHCVMSLKAYIWYMQYYSLSLPSSFFSIFATTLIKHTYLLMDTESVNGNSERNGVDRSWESDVDKRWTHINDESESQDGMDSSSLFPSKGRWPSDWFPLSPAESLSSSGTNSPQPKEKTKAVSNIRNQLRRCLDNFRDGTFAASGALPTAANPAIFVSNLGVVGLPLSDRDAEAIFDIWSKDRYRADQPGSSVSPRAEVCYLIPGQFEVRNPAWQQTLTEAVEKTAKALGFQTQSVEVKLAGLQICRPDATVDDQQKQTCSAAIADTLTQTSGKTRSAGFVMLMISLPSEHTGGEVAVTFEGKKKLLRTAAGSIYGFSYLSW